MIEILISLYMFISFLVLLGSTHIQDTTGNEFSTFDVVGMSLMWIVFLPIAIYVEMNSEA